MKSIELKIKIRKTYYDQGEDKKKFIAIDINDISHRKDIVQWFDGGILDYVEGFLDIKIYGKSWLDMNLYWSYPIHQMGILSEYFHELVCDADDFGINRHSTLHNIFFEGINKNEYLLYLSKKMYFDPEQDNKKEWDSIPKLFQEVVKKQDVLEEFIIKGIEFFEILQEIDEYHKEQHNKCYNNFLKAYNLL